MHGPAVRPQSTWAGMAVVGEGWERVGGMGVFLGGEGDILDGGEEKGGVDLVAMVHTILFPFLKTSPPFFLLPFLGGIFPRRPIGDQAAYQEISTKCFYLLQAVQSPSPK